MKKKLTTFDMWCLLMLIALVRYTSWYTALGFVCMCVPFMYSIKLMQDILVYDMRVVIPLSCIMVLILDRYAIFIPIVFPIFILSIELFIFIFHVFDYFNSGVETLKDVDSIMDLNKQRSLFGYIFTFKLIILVGVYMFVGYSLGVGSILVYSCVSTFLIAAMCYIVVINVFMSFLFKKRIAKLMVDK